MSTVQRCQICGDTRNKVILTKYRDSYVSTWVECDSCMSAHIEPYPSEVDLNRYYNSGYTDMEFSSTNDYQVNHKLRYSSEFQDQIHSEYNFSLADMEIDISTLPLKGSKVLDFGCANGVFLRYLLLAGLKSEDIFGCDISPKMLNDAALYTQNIFLSDGINKYQNFFDLVTLWDVIEHIHDPKEPMRNIVASLKVGGELLIQTPNYGVLAGLYGDTFAHYIVMEHINLFSRKALIDFVESLGMRVVKAGSFGANILSESNDSIVKNAMDRASKIFDFGATQVVRFIKI